jgi:hypothetical protein
MAQLYIAKSGSRNAPSLPIDAVARTFGVFGQRGTGKTNSAVVLAEEMVRKGGHVVILDPVGAWWGITHDGEGRGLPGIVLGGEHGDVPLEERAGRLVADLVVGRHYPVVVIDMKMLRKGAQLRFLADFLEELYFHNRESLHVFFEEADRALPQNPRGMDPVMGRVLGAAEDIVKLGRGRGLGTTLVSQRFATVNKNVTEQIETLLLHRMIGPNDQKAAKLWIDSNGDPNATKKVLDSLASLKVGEAQLYSPGWLGVLERVRMKGRKTFDSSATPEVGAPTLEPTARAPVDLDELREQMGETVERHKANDPKELRARLAEQETALAEAEATPAVEVVQVPAVDAEKAAEFIESASALSEMSANGLDDLAGALTRLKDFQESIDRVGEVADSIATLLDGAEEGVRARAERVPGQPESGSSAGVAPRAAAASRDRPAPAPPRPAAIPPPAPAETGGRPLKKVERAVLGALAQHPAGRTTKQLAVLTGYSQQGGGFRNGLGYLRTLGFISPSGAEPVMPTPEGLAHAESLGVEPLPTGRALLDHWLHQLKKKAEREVLEVVYSAYPDALTPEEVAARTPTQYEPSGGGFRNALGKLRTLELVEGRAEVRATEAFFA